MREEEEAWLPEFELLHASNGEEAYEIIRAGKEANRPIAVAYIDIRMPPGSMVSKRSAGCENRSQRRNCHYDRVHRQSATRDRPRYGIAAQVALYQKPFSHEEVQQITLSLVGKWNIERELTEKRRQLANNHRRLEAVLNAIGDAIAMYDSAGHLVFANQVYEKLLGLEESELKKIPPCDLRARFEERSENRICAMWRAGSCSIAAAWWKQPALAKNRSSGCSTAPPHRCVTVEERKSAVSSCTGTCQGNRSRAMRPRCCGCAPSWRRPLHLSA